MRDAIVVGHAVPRIWLEPTQTWLYTQVVHLPAFVESHVLCEVTRNLERFPFARVHSLAERGVLLRGADLLVRQLRLRRHLGFMARRARRLGVELVHSHFGHTAWEFVPVARACGARHVVSFYGYDVGYLPRHGFGRRYAEVFHDAAVVLCEGPGMARRVVELGCPPAKVRVHRLGVPVDRIVFAPRAWRPGERLRILMIAEFKEKKGLPCGIAAVGMLARARDLELTIVGGVARSARDRGEASAICRAIAEAALGPRVTMLGHRPHAEVHEIARRHHLLLAPSVTAASGDTEGGAPMAIVEMMASGMPVVSTWHCDIPEVVRHEQTGFLAPEGDAAGLAACLERMAASVDRWPAMLAAGRRHVETHFDARVQGRRLGGIYREVLEA